MNSNNSLYTQLQTLDLSLSPSEQYQRASMLRIYCLQAGFNNSRIEKIFEHMRHGKEPSVFKAWADIKHILNPEEHSYWNTVSNLLIYSSEEIEKNISAEEIVRAKTIYQKHIKSYLEKCLLIELHE